VVHPAAAGCAEEQPIVVRKPGTAAQRCQCVVCKRCGERESVDAIDSLRDAAAGDISLNTHNDVAGLKVETNLAAAEAAGRVQTTRCCPTIATARAGVSARPGERQIQWRRRRWRGFHREISRGCRTCQRSQCNWYDPQPFHRHPRTRTLWPQCSIQEPV